MANKRVTRDEWLERVSAWKASGLDAAAFVKGKRFSMPPATMKSCSSSSWSSTHAELFMIDLRALPADGVVADSFRSRQSSRQVGAVFSDSAPSYPLYAAPAEIFDALVFLESTTAARATARGRRPCVETVDEAKNLDFEEGEVGRLPPGWTALPPSDAFGYRALTAAEAAHAGKKGLLVETLDGPHYGELAGGAFQALDATSLRGQRMRLRAAARVDPEDGASAVAYVWLQVHRGTLLEPRVHARVAKGGWRTPTLELDVPTDATQVRYGLAFVGQGRGSLDDVTLEVIDPGNRDVAP